jgi:hypothetical protein
MKYSERDRDLAAKVCSIAACGEAGGEHQCYQFIAEEICDTARHSKRVATLALKAWAEVPDNVVELNMAEHDAWAEAMLRTGWEP